MSMIHGRLFDPENQWWLCQDIDLHTYKKSEAGIFSQKQWQEWGDGYDFEPISTAEELERLGSPRLPGLD